MGGAGAGLGGLIAGPVFLILCPGLLVAFLGWRFGRMAAFQRLGIKRTVLRVLTIAVIPTLFWSPVLCGSWSGNALGAYEALEMVAELTVAAGCFAGVFAAVSWAMNLDDFWAARRQTAASARRAEVRDE